VRLADFRGKPVVITVWASWCTACERQAAALRRLERRHEDVAVLGIDYQDEPASARRFYERTGWRHPSLADPEGELASRLGVEELPTTIFLDRRHRIVGRIAGPATVRALEEGLRAAKAAP
jgi:cytochrome c biogenesis protein CcmG/thiol:disulfide interchange protein DsbE